MTSYNEESLWNYIDGACSEEEKREIEQAMKHDLELRKAVAERMALHQDLQKIEAEEPSMRFATNIMEKLPKIKFKLSISPLIPPKVKRGFLFIMLGLFIAILGIVFSLPEQQLSNDHTAADPYVNQWVHWSTTLMNSPVFIMVACIGFSFVAFYYLDKMLEKRFMADR